MIDKAHIEEMKLVTAVDWGLDDQTAMMIRYWDGTTHSMRVRLLTRDDLSSLMQGQVIEFSQIDDPTNFNLENDMGILSGIAPQRVGHVPSNTKRGRQLNSRKVKRSGNWRSFAPGGKELERGARSYMVNTYPNGQPIPGHGIVNTMSKKQFDRDVEYVEG